MTDDSTTNDTITPADLAAKLAEAEQAVKAAT